MTMWVSRKLLDKMINSLDGINSKSNDIIIKLEDSESKLGRLSSNPTVYIINNSNNPLPSYKTVESAGMDLQAYLPDGMVTLQPMERKLIPTGLKIELRVGYEAQVRPRSGLALKNGITVLNSPGTIDSDYRGDVGIILINLSSKAFHIHSGDRIAQMVIARHEKAELINKAELSTTDRGEGGYGSTGVK